MKRQKQMIVLGVLAAVLLVTVYFALFCVSPERVHGGRGPDSFIQRAVHSAECG